MRKAESGTSLTNRNRYIRMCIAKTLIQLLAAKPLNEITVTALVKEANVSRMTFYKYYSSKEEVLSDYLYEIVNEYMQGLKQKEDIGGIHDLKHICYCLTFFKEHSSLIMTLVKADMYNVIMEALNNYMDQYVLPNSNDSRYDLYYYAGALCNVYIKWIERGAVESPEEIAEIVYKHLKRQR